WTRRYHSSDPTQKALGARVEITTTDGRTLVEEIALADAHPLGARPLARPQYVERCRTLADGVLEPAEIERFLDVAQRLPELGPEELGGLTIAARPGLLGTVPSPAGLF